MIAERSIVPAGEPRQRFGVIGFAGWLCPILMLAHQQSVAAIQFDDVTADAGFGFSGETYGAAWGEVNGDAWPDLFVSHHRLMKGLYINNGDRTFTDRGAEVLTWITRPNADTHGGSWADFDNDGDQDLMVSTGRGGKNQFFVNSGGQLTDQTVAYNVVYPAWAGRLPVWFDYNNDGLLDFVMGQYNGISPLIAQTAAGFTDITASTGMNCTLTPYGQFLDVNMDGRMEFVCGKDGRFPWRVYDVGTLPFLDLTATLPSTLRVVDTVIADFDGDLRQDYLLVRGNMRSSDAVTDGTNRIEAALVDGVKGFSFVTNGRVSIGIDWAPIQEGDLGPIRIGASGFSPAAVPFTLDPADPLVQGVPVHDPGDASSILIGYDAASQTWSITQYAGVGDDFSNGYVLVSSTSNVSNLTTTGFTVDDSLLAPVLFKAYGSGAVDSAGAAGLGAPVSCISATAADFDNDMDVDLYVVCRAGARNLANRLYENRGNGVFDEVVDAGGAQGPTGPSVGSGAGTSDSVVTADYDLDGFVDLFVTNGLNMRPVGVGGPDELYRNRGNSNHWVEIDLVGVSSNRDAIGTRVIATAGGTSQLREQNGGYHRWSQNHVRQHFGLAGNTLVDLRVEWPSGLVETHPGVLADRVYRITEGGGISIIAGAPVLSTLSIDHATVAENAGNAGFTVTLAPASTETVVVDYATADGTAVAGQDYTAASGTLTFAPGQTSQTVVVPILDDAQSEADETFTVTLGNAAHATLLPGGSEATGTITDNDLSACGTPSYDSGTTAAMFLWRNCTTGQWFARVTAGGSVATLNYAGTVTAGASFGPVVKFSIENNDTVNVKTSPPTITFIMKVQKTGVDGFNFMPSADASACVTLTSPASPMILVGAAKTPVVQPFRLDTFGPCEPPPAPMATPTVNSLVTNDTTPILTGTLDAARTVTLNVKVNGVFYTLGSSPRLTAAGDNWTLNLSTISPLATGTYPVTVTAIDATGIRATDTTTDELMIY